MKKDLKYYLKLNYPIELTKIPEDEGGGYSASIPLLGRNAFLSDGETIEEALKNLDIIKEENFNRMLEKGIPIPEPEEGNDEEFSGKFLVRVPKELHRELVRKSVKNGISLNQFIQYVILKGMAFSTFEEATDSYCNKFEQVLTEMKKIDYQIEEKKLYKDFYSPNLIHIMGEKKDNQYSPYSKVG